jgi:hypothetical protein
LSKHASVTTKLDYMLTGCANGHPVRIKGTGLVAGRRLRLAVWPNEVPLDLDPAVAFFAGCDALIAVFAGLVKPLPGEPFVARSRADFLGEGSVEVGTVVSVAAVERRRDRVQCRAQLAEASVAMEVGEKLVTIEERTITVAVQTDGVALMSATTVSTSRGRELTVLVSTRLVGCDADERRCVTLPAITFIRARHLARIAIAIPGRVR